MILRGIRAFDLDSSSLAPKRKFDPFRPLTGQYAQHRLFKGVFPIRSDTYQRVDVPAAYVAGAGDLDAVTNLLLELTGIGAATNKGKTAERRAGKECVSTCSSRGSPDPKKKNTPRIDHIDILSYQSTTTH